MKQVTYHEAVELSMFAGRDDVMVAVPKSLSDMTAKEVYQYGKEPGTMFFILEDQKEKQPKEPDSQQTKDLDIPKIKALRAAGWSYKKIADEMGCTEAVIKKYF